MLPVSLTRLAVSGSGRQQHHARGRAEEVLSKTAFLYGREYGKWETGKIGQIGQIDPKALVVELKVDPKLRCQMDDIKSLVPDAMEGVADTLQYAVGEAYAADVLSQWEGFGRFCREVRSSR